MVRVVGTDPGTSSLDLLLLDDGAVVDQARLAPEQLRDDPESLADLLARWAPIDLVAGPSGYGLPLVRGDALTEDRPRPDVAGPARRAGPTTRASSASGRGSGPSLALGPARGLPARADPPADDPGPPQG